MKQLSTLMNLEGRRALLTGAAGNLAAPMAHALAEQGADLVLVDQPDRDQSALAAGLRKRWGVDAESRSVDLEDSGQRSELMEELAAADRRLNILVNNAAFVGTSQLDGWSVGFRKQSLDAWRRAMEVNLTAAFHLCQGLAPLLSGSEGASIINIASIYGAYGPDWRLYEDIDMSNPAAYSVSKGGLIQLTRWLATTMAPEVRVNAVSPGGVFRDQPRAFVDRYAARTPLGRMAEDDDIAGTVAYLASDLSAYVTGQNLFVDGGWGIW